MTPAIEVYDATVRAGEGSTLWDVLLLLPIVELVMLLLVGMSVVSWAIMIQKFFRLSSASRQSAAFLDVFWKSKRLDSVYEQSGQFRKSPVAEVFKAGYQELAKLTSGGQNTDGSENLVRALRRASAVESTQLERYVIFLATTGSTEELLHGSDAPTEVARQVDISSDRRAFTARVRAELHALVRALSKEDWEEAAGCVRPEEEGWSPDEIRAAIGPFLEEFGSVGFDRRSRLAYNTVITPIGPHLWDVKQVLFPPEAGQVETYRVEGHEDDVADTGSWAIHGRIDLSEDTNPEGPLVRLVAIGE